MLIKYILLLICLLWPNCTEAKERLLFIPIDDRPVCLDYTVDTLLAAGWDVQIPPEDYIASYNRDGNPDKLYQWLEDNAQLATSAVVSSDSLIYGGLVSSRTHELPAEVLKMRTERLINLKKKFDGLRVYVYTTVMRSPKTSSAPVEPAYYGQYGPQIFRFGVLRDKQELGMLKRSEVKEMRKLQSSIPQDVLTDLYARRGKNLVVTERLLEGVDAGAFDYFLLGRDDTASYSDAHREARQLSRITENLPQKKVRFFAGADQLGLILLNRAVNRIQGTTPIVSTFYAEGVGEDTVPDYEDERVYVTLRNHILAAGGWPAKRDKNADLILAVNTPLAGKTLQADVPGNTTKLSEEKERFLEKVESHILQGKQVAIADVAYANGSDNALVAKLFKDKIAWSLAAYAGWNTAGNTIGFALGQGMLRPYFSREAKDDLMLERYLDEWAYQANVRKKIRQKLVWPNKWQDGKLLPQQRALVETKLMEEMTAFAAPYISGSELSKWQFALPWSRMFEIKVAKK